MTDRDSLISSTVFPLEVLTIDPGKQGKVTLPPIPKHEPHEEVFLAVIFRQRTSTAWADAGYEVASIQSRLGSKPAASIATTPANIQTSELSVEHTQQAYTISAADWSLAFDRATGFLSSWSFNERSLLHVNSSSPLLLPDFWRAPTDNDAASDAKDWKRWGLDSMTSSLRSISVSQTPSHITITTSSRMAPPILAWGFIVNTTYDISQSGAIRITVNIKPSGAAPRTVPHVGILLRLDSSLDHASWFGLGPGEAYADKKAAQRIGLWSADIDELHTPYEVPQENGNRMDTRWLRISDERGEGGLKVRMVRSEGEESQEKEQEQEQGLFEWTLSRYSAATLEAAKHPCDLIGKEEDAVLLRLDKKMAGVGTGACGPREYCCGIGDVCAWMSTDDRAGIGEKYEVKCVEWNLAFLLEPMRRACGPRY